MFEPAIIVHGGFGKFPSESNLKKPLMEGTKAAAREGHAILARGGSAIDAVEAAVTSMEDNPLFNCGK